MYKHVLTEILAGYRLKPSGTHGINHWARVLENGRRLAPLTGADQKVVDLFAIFHDSRRENEGYDPGHGARGGKLARQYCKKGLIDLNPDQLDLLVNACARQTCWDADRLDLGRVGILPDPAKLCTEAAKDSEVIAWADERAWSEWRSFALDDWLKT